MLAALGALWVNGQPVDWGALYPDSARCVSLPRYRWDRRRYWIAAGAQPPAFHSVVAGDAVSGRSLLGAPVRSPALAGTLFSSRLSAAATPWLGDHRVAGVVIVPAAAYLQMALTAANVSAPARRHRLEDVVIQRALALPEPDGREVQLLLEEPREGSTSFRFVSAESGAGSTAKDWAVHASGRIVVDTDPPSTLVADDLEAIRARCLDELKGDEHYARVQASGLECGPFFRALVGLHRGEGEALGLVDSADESVTSILDACVQTVAGAIPAAFGSNLYLPLAFERLRVPGDVASPLWSHVRLRPLADLTGETLVADVRVFTSAGTPVLEIDGLALKRAGKAALSELTSGDRKPALYQVEWRPQPPSRLHRAPSGRWLLFADAGSVASRLTALLEASGHAVQRVVPGTTYERRAGGEIALDPAQPEHFVRLLGEAGTWPCDGIVHAWNLAAPPAEDHASSPLLETAALGCASLLHLLKGLDAVGGPTPRLWIVTSGAQPVGEMVPVVSQAPAWGLGAVIAGERPELRCVCVDLDPTAGEDQAAVLFDELFESGAEERVALRGGERHVARLVTRAVARPAADTDDRTTPLVQLEVGTPGLLDDLVYRPSRRRSPGAGEVEIRVECTGLNFRDVLNVLGMYPGDAGPLGSECAGVVEAVGEGVEDLAAGDVVVAITTAGAFRSYVTVPAALAVRAPRGLSPAEAATIPIAFATARYALTDLAKLRAGERVLIHAAAGGVGLAAVQLAQRAGAEVFATAGSPAKRELLAGLGVRHVMDSRSLRFVEEIKAATGGAGVHVVLNSLSGDFIPAGLDVLGADGRFVEIGKAGIWSADRVAERRPDVSYSTLYLGEMCANAPGVIQVLLRELVAEVERGELRALPLTAFARSDATKAFRHMAHARHVGKIVVMQSDASSASAVTRVRPGASYLITGGLGGLGLKVARWMVAQGARHLVLMGRRGPSAAVRAEIDALERDGAHVLVVEGDVAQEADVRAALERIEPTMPRLRGIVHAAGVLDDGMLGQQTWERISAVMAPKMLGAWNLHRATETLALDFFVLFSSIAPLIGSPGQAGYAAGNAFLDMLAHARRRQGRVATTINWGPWAEVGMAAALADSDRRRWTECGLSPIGPEAGVQWLQAVLEDGCVQAVVLGADWKRFAAATLDGREPSFLADLLAPVSATRATPTAQPNADLAARLAAAPPTRRRKLLAGYVREQIVRVLGLDASQPLDGAQGFRELGMDSLMAVEVRNRLQASLARPLPSTMVFDHPNVDALCGYLGEVLDLDGAPAGRGDVRSPDGERAIERLSEAEAEALLLQELETVKVERSRTRSRHE
jgi:NADPH:quinone reductase-like Zn-dependent oxidoreductase/NADP-dependent 3-hydroxy acid dehydrogenase YdfG